VGNASAVNSVKGVVFASLSQYGDEFSEDCLTLNVWTKPQSGEKKKAVLVWIYGGGFALGNTASPSYNGARLAAEYDVLVVSMK
jgi:carboxylesterase type B